MIYLIKQVWFDEKKKDPHEAFDYKVIGYVKTLEEAQAIQNESGTVDRKTFGPAAAAWMGRPIRVYTQVLELGPTIIRRNENP